MSQVQSIGSQQQVRTAIARAASASGVDFDYLLAQAKLESNLDPMARSSASSAGGLYQFTNATWMQTLARHGAEFGIADPSSREAAMALRFDPQASALMAAGLASDNKAALTSALGHAPDASELYLAHFLGADGATKFLNALANDPSQSAAALLPAAAASNRAIFNRPDGSNRTVSEVMGLIRTKMDAAMSGAGNADWTSAMAALSPDGLPLAPTAPPPTGGPIAQAFHAAASQAGVPATAPERPSMAEVLQQTFALGTPAASTAPDNVRSAYAKLSAMGL